MPINDTKDIQWDEPVSTAAKPSSTASAKVEGTNDIEWDHDSWINVGGIKRTLGHIGKVYPAFETAANLMSSSYGVPISGLVGIAALPFGVENANRAIEATQKFLIYEPKTEEGKQLNETAMYPFKKIEEAGASANKKLTESGHPYLGLAADVGTNMLPVLAGMKGGIKTKSAAAKQLKGTVEYGINKGVRPSVVNKSMLSDQKRYMENAKVAVEEIVKNKENLRYADPDGLVSKGVPKTLDHFTQAIDQTKKSIFSEYDALAKQADAQGSGVSVGPVVKELRALQNDRVLQTLSPETIAYAVKREEALGNKTFTATETQNLIKVLNETDKAYRENKTPQNYGKAFVDSIIANNMRAGADAAIESATGIGYAPLKRKYGALRMLETDVLKRSIVDARKNEKGFFDLSDVFSGSQIAYGVFTAQPALIASGITSKGVSRYIKYRNNPNRAIRVMFTKADKLINKPQGYRALPIGGEIATSLAGRLDKDE